MHMLLDSADPVLAVRVEGTVDTNDIRTIYGHLDDKLKAHDDIAIMLDLTGFEDATRDAIDADIKRELSLLGNMAQFKRMAVMTDKIWVGYLAEWVGSVIPTMEVRMFGPKDDAGALDWANAV